MANNEALTKVQLGSLDHGVDAASLVMKIAENIPGYLWSTDSVGRFTYLNPSMEAFLGRTLAEFNSTSFESDFEWRRWIHPEDYEQVAAEWARCVKTGNQFVSEHRQRGAEGIYRWFRVVGRPSLDGKGTVTGWYGQTVDIEEQKRAEREYRDRTLELSLLVDMTPSHLWRLTPDGTTTLVNKRMADFLGLEVLDENTLETIMNTIFHPDDAGVVERELGRCLQTGDSFAMRYRLLRADGAYRWMSGRAEPLLDREGRIVQWFGLCHDIEDQVQATDALRRAADQLANATQAASLAELSASIAHEVNQPLAAIVTGADACWGWLSTAPPNVERAKLAVERITRHANVASDIVSRVRALFQHAPKSGMFEDVNLLINEVCSLMTSEIAANTVCIKTDLASNLPLVPLDRVQVQQVLVNLIRNGIQAMTIPADGTRSLEICSRIEDAGSVRIEVRDAGSGFDNLERVFEPFFTTKQYGMGMGLSICRSVVESHGGKLWIAKNDASGATVAFTLPLVAADV